MYHAVLVVHCELTKMIRDQQKGEADYSVYHSIDNDDVEMFY